MDRYPDNGISRQWNLFQWLKKKKNSYQIIRTPEGNVNGRSQSEKVM